MRQLLAIGLILILAGCASLVRTEKDEILSVYIKPEILYKGEIVILNFENLDSDNEYELVLYSKQKYKYRITPDSRFTTFFLGIPLNSPDVIEIELKENSEIIWEQKFKLHSKKIDVSKVIVKQRYVTPPEKVIAQIEKERELIQRAKKEYTDEQYFEGKPVFPVKSGRITTPFGYKRIYNHKKKSTHYGTDIAAPEGTPVKAILAGEVILTGEFYYTGKTIFINNGKGIITMYAHLSEILVEKGDFVDKGKVIGKVGQTGRATGPHLHLSVYANRIAIDPMCLFRILKNGE